MATLLVAVCPIVVAWWLRVDGVLESVLLSATVSMALALGAAYAGNLFWSTRDGSRDLLFSELMLWGWLRRLWIERRLTKAQRLLGDGDVDPEMDPKRRATLLAQLAAALEARDPYTHGHSRRVARHSTTIAKRMGLSRQEVATVRAAAVVHDVGKMTTPDSVLRKGAELTDDEFAVIKEHPTQGAEMVAKLGNPQLTAMVLYHHERLDGSGYPDGLIGSSIPLGARIIAVADTFDAITSTRPYRASRSHREAIAILHAQAGRSLDSDAVRAFQHHYSGRRPLAAWIALTNVPERLLSWLSGGVSVATGSAARVVATSALTGAAAVTAVVGTHTPHLAPPAFGHTLAATASGGSGPGAVSQQSLTAAIQHGQVVPILASGNGSRVNISLGTQQPAGLIGPATTQLAGAIGAVVPTAGSASRGLDQIAAGGQGRGELLLGRGGQGTGAGRIIQGIPTGPQSSGAGGGDQTPGAGGGDQTQGTDGVGRGGSQNNSGGDGTQVVVQTPDTGDSTPPDSSTTPPDSSQTPPDSSQTPPDSSQTPPADDTQTPPVDTTQTPPPPTSDPGPTPPPADDTQTPPVDTTQTPPADTPPADTTQTQTDPTQTDPSSTDPSSTDSSSTSSTDPSSTDTSSSSTDTSSTDPSSTSTDTTPSSTDTTQTDPTSTGTDGSQTGTDGSQTDSSSTSTDTTQS